MADKYIALNGCDVACATKALKSIKTNPNMEYCITKDFSINKNNNYNDETKLEAIIEDIKRSVSTLHTSPSR